MSRAVQMTHKFTGREYGLSTTLSSVVSPSSLAPACNIKGIN